MSDKHLITLPPPKAGDHGDLGASGASGWGFCPGRVRMSRGIPNRSSVAAAEGTAAHALAEFMLKAFVAGIPLQAKDAIGETIDVNQKIDGHDGIFTVDEEMAAGVQLYVDVVLKDLSENPNALFLIEQRFHLDWLHPALYGTNDACVGEHYGLLRVYDLKYGRNHAVEVPYNVQLMYYGLGAAYGHDFNEIELVIVQPRAFHSAGPVRRWRTTTAELQEWGRDVLLPAALATEDPDAPLRADPDNCQYCRALSVCPEVVSRMCEAFDDGFVEGGCVPAKPNTKELTLPDPRLMSGDMLGQSLDLIELLTPWAKAVKEAAKEVLLKSNPVEGWKLVAGKKGRRQWKSETDASETFAKAFGDDAFEPRVPLSPAKMEKLFANKKEAKLCLTPLVDQPAGAPVLAPEFDARPGIVPSIDAQKAFEDFKE